MIAGDLVGRVRRDEADAVVPSDPGQERHELSRSRVGIMEVLEHDEHRLSLRQPTDQPQNRFQHAALASFRGSDRRPLRECAGIAQPRLELGEESDHVLGRRSGQADELVVGRFVQDRSERPDDRPIGLVGTGPV